MNRMRDYRGQAQFRVREAYASAHAVTVTHCSRAAGILRSVAAAVGRYLPYSEQLKYKARFVSDGLERIGKLEGIIVDTPLGSAEEFYYRNKMEYSFRRD